MPSIVSRYVQVHVHRRCGEGTEYLLLRRAEDEPLHPGLWQMVTGTLEPDERALACARRELLEETGIEPNRLVVVPYVASFFSPVEDAVHMIPVFAAEAAGDAPVRLSREHQDFIWLPYSEARKRLTFPGHHAGLDVCHRYICGTDLPGDPMPALY
jgi:8-oxo-dGTP pyrophosphatase MutT (NUDIX family)